MSDGLNQVVLVGNLGNDPELRMVAGGQAVLTMRLATTESYLDRDRNRQERTEWHTVTVWGKRAEGLSRILSKGSKICVTGGLRTSSWDGNDGTKRYRTEIQARQIVLCGGGQQRQPSAPADDYGSSQYGGNYNSPPDDRDDDIPF